MGGHCGGPEASLSQRLPPGSSEEPRAWFSAREASRPCFLHSGNSLSWFPMLSGRCLLGSGVLKKQHLQRSAEVWRRGSKGREERRLPLPQPLPKALGSDS